MSAHSGHGKPSTKRIKAALGAHLAEGSIVVHDEERAHNGVISERGCGSEAYKADVTDPAYLDAMEMVNNLSSWLKRYLWRFAGMGPVFFTREIFRNSRVISFGFNGIGKGAVPLPP